MKIDDVLEAHGIGIVQLSPPVPANGIVTNGLVGYWNSKQGVSGTTWANIAPATQGQYNGTMVGVSVTANGMDFQANPNSVTIPVPDAMKVVTNATFECRMIADDGWMDVVSQSDGRELFWIGPDILVPSGLFDADHYTDKFTIYTQMANTIVYLTVTADLTTNRITWYFYYPATGTTVSEYYATAIGTMAAGNVFLLSGTAGARYYGILDNVRIYNRVLTAAEIAKNRAVGTDVGL